MRNIRKLILILFTFFIGFMTVNAAGTTVTYGSVIPFITGKQNLSCTSHLNFLKLVTVTDGYAVQYDRDPNATVNETVDCTYTENGATVTKTFTFKINPPTSKNVSVTLSNSFEESKTADIGALLWGDKTVKVISASITGSNVTLNCPEGGKTCKVTATDFPENTTKLEATIEYEKDGKKIVGKVTVRLNPSSSLTAKMGTYGTCNFGTGWNVSGTNALSERLGSLSLPSCTPKGNYPLLEFKGWSKGARFNDVNAQHPDTCVDKLVVTGAGTYNATASTTLYACYATAQGATLFPGSFTIEDSSWIAYGNNSYYQKGTSITLPTPKENKVGNREFKGWQDKSGREYEAGATVTAAGQTFTPMYETVRVFYDYNKSIFKDQTSLLSPYGVTISTCSVSDTEYVTNVSSAEGECQLYGVKETTTPVDVIVSGTKDGQEYQQTFKITVVSPYSGESVIGSDQFILNITPNVISSVNNYSTLNEYQTDSCNEFTYNDMGDSGVSSGNGEEILRKYNFTSNPASCNGQRSSYIGFCLDAGRENPNSSSIKYARTQDLNNDSDYAKLINYLAAKGLLNSDANFVDTNFLLRIVGYLDGITIASDYNALDTSHAEFYNKYASLAEYLLDGNGHEKLDSSGNFDSTAVAEMIAAAEMNINSDVVTDVLTHYKNGSSYNRNFTREINNVTYCNDSACAEEYDGSNDTYYVKYEGIIATSFGQIELLDTLKGGTTVKGVTLVSDKSTFTYSSEEEVDTGTSSITIYKYDFEIVLKVSINELRVPKTKDEEKEMSVQLKISSRSTSAITDVFISEATGTHANRGFQRMLMFNTDAETIYVYFSPALTSNYCKIVDSLDPTTCTDAASCGLDGSSLSSSTTTMAGTFNPSLFTASGCCNFITDESNYEFLVDNICSNKCSTTTLVSVCDYRAEFTGNQNEVYDVTESRDRQGNYKVGGYPSCIVNTENHSEEIFNRNDSAVNREDEAGNSLMVQMFKNNRYCRVSCGEEWQLTTESYGNYLGANAVAAGSYFELVHDSMFVSGKRTCYTTFINYGTNVNDNSTNSEGIKQEEIKKNQDSGFTEDVTVESDKLIDGYNLYANLSHVYADLACSWDNHGNVGDDSQTTDWRNACKYNNIKSVYNYYCISASDRYYCAGTVDNKDAYYDGSGLDHIPATDETSPFKCYTRNYPPSRGDESFFKEDDAPSKATVTEWTEYQNSADEAKQAAKDLVSSGAYDNKYDLAFYTLIASYRSKVHPELWWSDQEGSSAQTKDDLIIVESDSTSPNTETNYSCPSGYTADGSGSSTKCYKNKNASGSCDSGHTAVPDKSYCYKNKNASGSCDDGYSSVSSYCYKNPSSSTSNTGCPTGYNQSGSGASMTCTRYRARAKYYFYYNSLSFSKCDAAAEADPSKWGMCIVYSLETNEKFDDGLPYGDSDTYDHNTDVESHPGYYVGYVLDTQDKLYSTKVANHSGDLNTRSVIVPYSTVKRENQTTLGDEKAPVANYATIGISNIRTGNFNPDALDMGYVYYSPMYAREWLVNEKTDGPKKAYLREGNAKLRQNRAYTSTYAAYYDEFGYYGQSDTYAIQPTDGYARYIKADKAEATCKTPVSITVNYAATSDTDGTYTASSAASSYTYIADSNVYTNYEDYSFNTFRTKKTSQEISESIGDNRPGGEQSAGTEDGNVHVTEDTALGAEIRRILLGYTGIGTQQTDLASGIDTGSTRAALLNGAVKDINQARSNIVSYTEDLFACQHFELYNTSDDDDPDYKNNSLSSSHFLGMKRSFIKINTAFKPDISYTYDEQEYMTIIGSENVMIKFQALNAKYWCGYDMEHRSSDATSFTCYNDATNQQTEITETGKNYYSKYYLDGEEPDTNFKLFLSRNYTESFVYDTEGHAWQSETEGAFGLAESYGAYLFANGLEFDEKSLELNGSKKEITDSRGILTKITKYSCDGADCNMGDESHLQGATYFQRVFFCTIGEVEGIGHVSGSYAKGGSWSYSYTIRNKDAAWTDGECYVVEAQYLRANYVKASIENSSFYVNRGNWYLKDNDIKVHGDNLVTALNNSGYSDTQDEIMLWTKIGSYNVFPIKMTTPRGIYTYTYTFSDIGSTSTGTLGRIMGSPTALITLNRRTCFYEVFEDVCLCCGNLIDTEYEIPDYGFPELTISASDFEEQGLSKYATLGFFPSTISLSDMEPGDVQLSNNWQESSPFFYNNNVYEINSGHELLEAIQGKGDNAYYETPEYSYSLSPGMLSAIRDYNDEYGYGVSYDRLEAIGKFSITPFDDNLVECEDASGCNWEVDGSHEFRSGSYNVTDLDEVINFQHYASKFLENEIIYRGHNDSLIDVTNHTLKDDCFVTYDDLHSEDPSEKHKIIMDKVAEGCRWVDYVEESTSVKKYDYQVQKTKLLRVAFK